MHLPVQLPGHLLNIMMIPDIQAYLQNVASFQPESFQAGDHPMNRMTAPRTERPGYLLPGSICVTLALPRASASLNHMVLEAICPEWPTYIIDASRDALYSGHIIHQQASFILAMAEMVWLCSRHTCPTHARRLNSYNFETQESRSSHKQLARFYSGGADTPGPWIMKHDRDSQHKQLSASVLRTVAATEPSQGQMESC